MTGSIAASPGAAATPILLPPPLAPSIDITSEVDRLVGKYDRDGDGSINVTAFGNETERYTSRRHGPQDGTRVGHLDDLFLDQNVSSIERLARMADLVGDGNGQATKAEIEHMMRLYDHGDAYGMPLGATSGDGTLEFGEYRSFQEDLGEEYRPRWRVDKAPPKPTPLPTPLPTPPWHPAPAPGSGSGSGSGSGATPGTPVPGSGTPQRPGPPPQLPPGLQPPPLVDQQEIARDMVNILDRR